MKEEKPKSETLIFEEKFVKENDDSYIFTRILKSRLNKAQMLQNKKNIDGNLERINKELEQFNQKNINQKKEEIKKQLQLDLEKKKEIVRDPKGYMDETIKNFKVKANAKVEQFKKEIQEFDKFRRLTLAHFENYRREQKDLLEKQKKDETKLCDEYAKVLKVKEESGKTN